MFLSAAGGANWPITTSCPSLGPPPSAGGAHRPLTPSCPPSPSAWPILPKTHATVQGWPPFRRAWSTAVWTPANGTATDNITHHASAVACMHAKPKPTGGGGGVGCIRRVGTSEAAPEAVRQAVGAGCQSGWGRLLSVTNAIEAGTCRQGDSGWAQAGRSGGGVGGGTSSPSNASRQALKVVVAPQGPVVGPPSASRIVCGPEFTPANHTLGLVVGAPQTLDPRWVHPNPRPSNQRAPVIAPLQPFHSPHTPPPILP